MKDSAPISIKLISLNIERSKHLGTVLPFLDAQKPDIVCVQEILENDILRFVAALDGAEYVFAPALRHMETQGNPIVGEAIFSRLRVARQDIQYYVGNANDIPESRPSEAAKTGRSLQNCTLVTAAVEKEGNLFTVGTTHFTWSLDGEPSMAQRMNMKELLGILKLREEFVLTGDFNAPRGGEIFSMLANAYKDNVPARYTTSIDGRLHRAGQLNLMVDGLFSTPQYSVSNVEMVCGLSDHCALVATVSKM
ncbi:MAG TPA: endonuclease/exonuclease/phosphatase family protein [Candidatus Paceibacterota bacterium]|nr:endonuclease/exonuclease/phosphatase family protein [Candidatus Paceibacterota bacterium]